MYPSYLNLYNNGTLSKVADEAFKLLESCTLCPRKCRVNRVKGETGFCKTGLLPKVCSFMPHHGEEPPISGTAGSGTIFFSCCNMACVYCQNYEFSQSGQGREAGFEELADFMLQLQNMACHNINLVTPTHVMPQILKALSLAVTKGLQIPLVYNTGGYELPQVIKLLEGIVDIYLADMRYGDPKSCVKYSAAPEYPEYNQLAVSEMQLQVGIAKFDNQGIIKRGLVVRHLVLPNNISGTDIIMKFISDEVSKDTYISLMSQYLPYHKASGFKEISRRLTLDEYESAKEIMQRHGLYNGWIQESYGLERFAGVHIKPSLKKLLLCLALPCLLFFNLSCARLDSRYNDILAEARSGDIHFSFMKLRDYLRDNPDSMHTGEIKFGICEYYFEIKDYRDAIRQLSEYITDYPDGRGLIPAKALLYRSLLEYKQEKQLLEKIRKSFFSKSLFLTFSKAKTRHYRSVFDNDYKILDYIDRIEIFKNNELILKITP